MFIFLQKFCKDPSIVLANSGCSRAYYVKIFIILFLLIYQVPAKADHFYIESYNNANPQKNEISLASFDDNYDYNDFPESSLQLFIDGIEVQIDSILYFNAQSENKSSIFIAIEYSNAIKDNDLSIIESLLDFYSEKEDSINCEIAIALFSDNPILIKNNQEKEIRQIITPNKLQLYAQPRIDKLIGSPYFQSFINNSKYSKQFLIISKSRLQFDSINVLTLLQNNQIKLSNIILPMGIPSNITDIAKLTRGNTYRIEDNLEKIKHLSFYNLMSENYHKIFYKYNFCSGEHSVKVSTDKFIDSLNFTIYPNEIADIFPKCNFIDFGEIDSGRTSNKEIIFQIKNNDFHISEIISSDTTNFKIIQNYNGAVIKRDSLLKITIQYKPRDTLFHYSQITIRGENCQIYNFNTYGGVKPNYEDYSINITAPSSEDIIFSNELAYIKWTGSHPDDTLWLEYRLKGDVAWHTISKLANNNCFAFQVPEIEDTLMQFRISMSKPVWVSDKVVQLQGHKAKITDICWTSDNSELITSSEDGKIYLWNTSTGKLIKALFQSQLNMITGIDLTKDDRFIAVAANDSVVKIWDRSNEILYKELHCSEMIQKIKFSYDDTKAIGVSSKGNIFIWDVKTAMLYYTKYSQSPVINVLAANPTRNIFATASKDGKINIWNIANGNLIKNIFSANFEILDLKWSPSGTSLLFSGNDIRIRIFDIDEDRFVQSIFEEDKPLRASEWATNYPFILNSNGTNINIWTISDAKFQKQYNQHISNVYRINSSNSSPKIASVDNSHTIHIWSLDDFPFERPQIIYDTTSFVKVINKKFATPDLILPLCQVGDTIYLYYDNFVQNLTNELDNGGYLFPPIYVQIDSVYQPIHNPTYDITTSTVPFFLGYDESAPMGLTFTPKTNYDFSTTISTSSGIKTINSNVQVSILEKNLDKKAYFINFGNIPLGNFKDTIFYLFQNISQQNISIDSVHIFYDSSFSLITPSVPYNLSAKGGVFVPTFRFKPKHIGYSSALAIFYFHNSLKLYCNFSGYSVGPRLEAPSEIYFDTVICDNSAIKQVNLYNSGLSILSIKNLVIENDPGNNFHLLSETAFDLEPKETKTIEIEFNSTKSGNFNSVLKIITNLQSNLDTIKSVMLFSNKEIILLDTLDKTILFSPTHDTNRIQKIIEIKNLGSLQSFFSIITQPTWFEIDSVKYAYPMSLIYCTFMGGDNRIEYLDSMLIKDECDRIYKINLIASINRKSAILKTVDNFNMGIFLCPGINERKIKLENEGDTTLVINNIILDKKLYFSIVSDFPIIIEPKKFYDLSLFFEGQEDGYFNDTLIIESNAFNSENGFIYIPIFAEKNSIKYNISNDVLDFDTLWINQSDTLSFYIFNANPFPLKLDLSSTNPNFYISNTSYVIPVNDSARITVEYRGSSITGYDNGQIIIIDTCDNQKIIQTRAFLIEDKDIYSISLLKPNPTDEIAYIEIISNRIISYEIRIFDLNGKLISQFPRVDNFQGNIKFPLNTRNIAQGVYIVEIATSKERTIRKLIKLK